MRLSMKFVALSGILLTAPVLASAQAAGRGGMPGAPMGGQMVRGEGPGAGVTQILNARRQLDLTARQVAQLDSIERALFADRARIRTQMQAQGQPMADSLRARVRAGERPLRDEAAREALRGQMVQRRETLRPQMEQLRQRDSAARAAAQRTLTDAQRQQLREVEAERRGYARGQRDSRMGQRPNARFGPRQGMRPQSRMAPRQGVAPQGRMMPREGRPAPRQERRPE